MSRTTIFGLLAALIVAAGVLWLLFSHPGLEEAPLPTRAEGITLTGYGDENPLWRVHAAAGEMEGDARGRLLDAKTWFYVDGEPYLEVVASTLVLSGDERIMSGGVTADREDAYRLRSEEVRWHVSDEELTSGPVTIEGTSWQVQANRYRYALDEERSFLDGDVIVEFDGPPPVRITAETAEGREETWTLSGDVAVSRGDSHYRCGSLDVEEDGEVSHLFSGVEGTFPSGEITAESILFAEDGSTASGGVHLRLERDFFGEVEG